MENMTVEELKELIATKKKNRDFLNVEIKALEDKLIEKALG